MVLGGCQEALPTSMLAEDALPETVDCEILVFDWERV